MKNIWFPPEPVNRSLQFLQFRSRMTLTLKEKEKQCSNRTLRDRSSKKLKTRDKLYVTDALMFTDLVAEAKKSSVYNWFLIYKDSMVLIKTGFRIIIRCRVTLMSYCYN